MLEIAKWIVLSFGIFIIIAGFIMVFKPQVARTMIRKAGSTTFINYGEITLRLIVAIALLTYANFSKFPKVFMIAGWFMFVTSLFLYAVPKKVHHQFASSCAAVLKPLYLQLLAPVSILLGVLIIYNTL